MPTFEQPGTGASWRRWHLAEWVADDSNYGIQRTWSSSASNGRSSSGETLRDEFQRASIVANRNDVVLQMAVDPPEIGAGKTHFLLDDRHAAN